MSAFERRSPATGWRSSSAAAAWASSTAPTTSLWSAAWRSSCSLPSLAEDPAFRERFLVESRLAASLDHPNVVPIYDAGEVEGQLYLAMRYVEGSDLKRLLTERGAARACARDRDLLADRRRPRRRPRTRARPPRRQALQRPARRARARLSGRLRPDADGSPTQAPGFESGLSLGTPAYVAPEQIEGNEVDGRADQYSLACLLHECLTGEPPFPRGSEAATLFAHLEEPPPAPPGLESVMARALAKSPDERYPTCAEFVADARRALDLEPKRARWPLALAGVGAAVLGAALLAFFLTNEGGSPGVVPGTDSLVRIDPATNDVVSSIRVGQNPSAVATGGDGSVWVASRDDGNVWKVDPDQNRAVLNVSAHGKPTDLAVAGGRVIVSNGPQDANVVVIDASTGREESVIRLGAISGFGSAHVAAGRAGLWVADGDRRIGRLDLTLAKMTDPTSLAAPRDERADAFFSSVAVSGDAIWILGDANDRTLWRIDPASGDVVERIALDFVPKDVATGDGAVWVTSQLDDTVSRIDTETHEVTATTNVGKGAAGVAVGAGSVWVANAIDGTISRIDPATARVTETIEIAGSPEDIVVGKGAVWVVAHEITDAAEGSDDDAVKIGVLTACEGVFGFLADGSITGAELPLLRRGAKLAGPLPNDGVVNATVAGKPVRLLFGCSDDTAESTLSEARRLVEHTGVDILIGPTQIAEAIAIHDYAKRQPDVTFVNGTASGQSLTLLDPVPNVYSFALEGAQAMAGAGAYAFHELGWRNVVTVGDDEAFNYTQAAGFLAEFCALGGTVGKRIWVPLSTQDYAPYVAQVPRKGVDGFVMVGAQGVTLAFTNGVPALGGNLARKVILGILSSSLQGLGGRFSGVVLAQPIPAAFAREPRSWAAYGAEYAKAFPKLAGFGPYIFAVAHHNAMEAVLTALERVDGDLSEDQGRFRSALAALELEAPQGHIRLDENRRAVGPNYLHKVVRNAKGRLGVTTFRSVPNVEQTFGGYFKPGAPTPAATSPPCTKGNPPSWAKR